VVVTYADSQHALAGTGPGGSRHTVVVSGAVAGAAAQVKEKIRRIAATKLEASERDLAFRDGGVSVRARPSAPKTLDGQIIGGTIQGLGTALYEHCLYDERGRVRNETFEYYHLPSSMDVPTITVGHQETPSPYTPYGIKGAGEGGRMLTPAILSAAIEDALSPHDVRITSLPITAEKIVEWVATASA